MADPTTRDRDAGDTLSTIVDVPGLEAHRNEVCANDYPAAHTIRDVLARLGDKWSLLVVGLLGGGPQRFTELQRRIDGISHRMLTQTLRSLERDGLVRRTAYPEIPPRVEYRLTPLGASLMEPVLGLVTWAATHHHELTDARDRYDDAHGA